MQPGESERKARERHLVFDEVQLLLAEKRTALSGLRTGIAVFVLPLSVLSALIATSRYYQPGDVVQFLAPLLVICAALIVLGCYLIVHAIRRIHHYDRLIHDIKTKHSAFASWID